MVSENEDDEEGGVQLVGRGMEVGRWLWREFCYQKRLPLGLV